MAGWCTKDFTYRELRTLRAKERLPAVGPDNTAYDGQERVPTLDEVIRDARREGVGGILSDNPDLVAAVPDAP